MRLVIVSWRDAWSSSKSWYTKAELRGAYAYRVTSKGYLIRDDDKCVILTRHNKPLKNGEWKGITYIPRVCISKVSPYRSKGKVAMCRVRGVYSCP